MVGFRAASLNFTTAPFKAFTLVLGSPANAAIQPAIEASRFLLFGGEALSVAV